MKPRYQQEFPDFPDLEVAIPDGFKDTSWHNDTCPSFEAQLEGGLRARIIIDYPDNDKREFAGNLRFNYWVFDPDTVDRDGVPGAGSDNWQGVLDWAATCLLAEYLDWAALVDTYVDAARELHAAQRDLQSHADELYRFFDARDKLRGHPDFTGKLPPTFFSGGDLDPD